MALVNKIILCPVISHSSPLINFKSIPHLVKIRYNSECSDGGGNTSKGLFSPSDQNPSDPTMYDCRKYGHQLPSNNITPEFDVLKGIPSGVFRCTTGEVLGNYAGKCSCYKNPEYFSFQHMTFFDMNLYLRKYRKASPKTKRKPP